MGGLVWLGISRGVVHCIVDREHRMRYFNASVGSSSPRCVGALNQLDHDDTTYTTSACTKEAVSYPLWKYQRLVTHVRKTAHRDRRARLWRMLIVCLMFSFISSQKLYQQSFIVQSLRFVVRGDERRATADMKGDTGEEHNLTTDATIDMSSPQLAEIEATTIDMVPSQSVDREWDRMLFGIFTYDSPNEADIRAANRETHLSYFKHNEYNLTMGVRPDFICSLKQLLSNATLSQDAESCRIVYTFVMGGGVGDDNLRKKVSQLKGGRNAISKIKTRCLYEDSECGGKDITKWTLDSLKCDISNALAHELKTHDDITLLSIAENHELGKTDTWFTYASMLTRQHPELKLGFVGKMDSDNLIRWALFLNYLKTWPVYLRYLEISSTKDIDNNLLPFIYGGYAISKKDCSGKVYDEVCKQPNFIADCFVAGAFVYLSTPLAQHVFMDGTTLERKSEVWIVGEDMQLANMVYSDRSGKEPIVINHRIGPCSRHINTHCFNNAATYREEYYKKRSPLMTRRLNGACRQ